MKRRFLSLLLVALLVFPLFNISASAEGIDNYAVKDQITSGSVDVLLPIASSSESTGPKKVPNGIPITSTVRTDGTGIDVHVGNIGVDGLDSVTVTVSATGYLTPKSATYYVPPVIGKTFSFDFPFIVVNTTYNITIKIVDGSGTKTLYRTASLEYTEEILTAQGWGA